MRSPPPIWLNERWLAGEVRAGATVLDIGPDFARRAVQGASPYYMAELRVIERLGADSLRVPFERLAGLLAKFE